MIFPCPEEEITALTVHQKRKSEEVFGEWSMGLDRQDFTLLLQHHEVRVLTKDTK